MDYLRGEGERYQDWEVIELNRGVLSPFLGLGPLLLKNSVNSSM